MSHDLPDNFDPYLDGRVVDLDPAAVERAAHAMAIHDGDGRAYDEDPDFREGCAEVARLVISLYLGREAEDLRA